ncbi:hypothetical protein J437_LFUL010653 [Ladona fulva]|uniref:Endonuclease/exonuclease/phosphatase domain-containing protein n=1 Tax=Ladona fulva TaxID=123851 RepID=A0A8K0KW70_LADFU|nr:hypothetical protein J437_LFUL010653 [Ladona fulva]
MGSQFRLLWIVRQIQGDQTELKTTLNALHRSLADQTASLEKNTASISALTVHVEELRTEYLSLSNRVSELETHSNHAEQEKLKNVVEIRGVCSIESERTDAVVIQVGMALGVKIDTNYYSYMPKARALSKLNRKLYRMAKDLKKKGKTKYLWVRGGRIYVRKCDGGDRICVVCLDDELCSSSTPDTHFRSDSLLICHCNCQSLFYHLDELRVFLLDNHFDIVCLYETWPTPSVLGEMIKIHNYNLVRHDRIGKGRGGTAVYVSQTLNYSILASSSAEYCSRPEFILLEIFGLRSSKLLLCVVYRPPKTGRLDELQLELSRFTPTFRNIVIMGDFNSDLLKDTCDSRHIKDFVHCNNLYIVPYGATHHVGVTYTFLDLCIIPCFLSSHDLINITYRFITPFIPPPSFMYRDLKNFDVSRFLAELNALDWTEVFKSSNLDGKLDCFNSNLLSCINHLAPFKLCTSKRSHAPWINDEVRELIRQRNRVRCFCTDKDSFLSN